MKICHVWDSDYPWDVRVEKVNQALAAHGHEVHLVARNRKRLSTEESIPEGLIHRLRPIRLSESINSVSSFPAFFNPRWLARINEVASKYRVDVLLVRDLPLAPTAVVVGRRLRIPVILDMAENYPAMIQAVWDAGRQRPWDIIVRNPTLVSAVEKWVLSKVDHTIVVIEESRDRLVHQLGVDPRRITTVLNTPPIERLQGGSNIAHPTGGPLRLFYLGLLEAPRGISELIRAVSIARGRGIDVELDIVGSGREEQVFRHLADELGMDDAVRFHGFLAYERALELMRSSHVGVVPHYANQSWSTTIPNKLFDYMAAGIPVLASDVRPVARIIEGTGSGLIYRDRDSHDAARAIESLIDPDIRQQCGTAGREAIQDRYNWSVDGATLVRCIENTVNAWTRS